MWKITELENSEKNKINLKSVLLGQTPAIIIRDFYDKKNCEEIVNRIKKENIQNFRDEKLKHIGPFLMSYITEKKKYFENVKQCQTIFEKIFLKIKKPNAMIYEFIQEVVPDYSISLGREGNENYSPFIIRIHEKGKSSPIHKDNVSYEGREYLLSNIDQQLSCILHLQESEGGDLIIYDKKWKKQDEKFRDINFGYSSDLIKTSKFCKISDLRAGDLVIINPNYYHQVTKINGDMPRITLGMFLGLYNQQQKIVAWA